MSTNKQTLRVVIASPGDVVIERKIARNLLSELNGSIGAVLGVQLEASGWETDAYPGFHAEGPQGLIDPILRIEDCDVLIGIFWKRFGSPTKSRKSGTEHEILTAYKTWEKNHRPQVMVYFNQKPYSPQSVSETEQWGQVLEFRDSFPKEGLWWPYRSTSGFEKLLRTHLTNFLRATFPISQTQDARSLAPSLAEHSTAPRSAPHRAGSLTRLFPGLPAARFEERDLLALAGGMISDEPTPTPEVPMEGDAEENSGISAGYTYLGQFIYHDLTFDENSRAGHHGFVDYTVESPSFDLSCIYGGGPAKQPYLYSQDGLRMVLGEILTGSDRDPKARQVPRSNPNVGGPARALIADPRNDENVILSQLHAAMLRFHNRVADIWRTSSLEEIQRLVRFHYQWVVLYDFLPTIIGKEMLESILPHVASRHSTILQNPPRLNIYKPENGIGIPVEFSAAAFRFGHAMIRPMYRLNQQIDRLGPLPFLTTRESLAGFRNIPSNMGIDWGLFFKMSEDGPRVGPKRVQPAYKFDTSLLNQFGRLPKSGASMPSLAARNLLRGLELKLPSGQEVARAMGIPPFSDEQLTVGSATKKQRMYRKPITAFSPEFKNNAPLWFYILAEAQSQFKNDDTPIRLGSIGGRIVGEVLVGLMYRDIYSFLNVDPSFQPHPALRSANGEFRMADLLRQASQA